MKETARMPICPAWSHYSRAGLDFPARNSGGPGGKVLGDDLLGDGLARGYSSDNRTERSRSSDRDAPDQNRLGTDSTHRSGGPRRGCGALHGWSCRLGCGVGLCGRDCRRLKQNRLAHLDGSSVLGERALDRVLSAGLLADFREVPTQLEVQPAQLIVDHAIPNDAGQFDSRGCGVGPYRQITFVTGPESSNVHPRLIPDGDGSADPSGTRDKVERTLVQLGPRFGSKLYECATGNSQFRGVPASLNRCFGRNGAGATLQHTIYLEVAHRSSQGSNARRPGSG